MVEAACVVLGAGLAAGLAEAILTAHWSAKGK